MSAPTAVSTAAVVTLAVAGLVYWGSGGPSTTHPATARSGAAHAAQSETCEADALQMTVGGPNGAGGTTYLRLTVKNQGSTACVLHDSDLQIRWGHHNPIDLNPYARRDQTLPAGAAADYRIGFSGRCVAAAARSSTTSTPLEVSVHGAAATVHGNGIPSTVTNCTSATFGALAAPGQTNSTPAP